MIKRYGFLVVTSGLVVALDQLSKGLVRATLSLGESWNPFPILSPYINITHWQNNGAAFGLFQSGGTLFMIVAFAVSGIIIYYYGQALPGNRLLRVALSLQLGGAIGNLIDRVRQGPVTDFIHVTNFPIFNVADSSISVGVALLALTMLLERRPERGAGAGAPETAASRAPNVEPGHPSGPA